MNLMSVLDAPKGKVAAADHAIRSALKVAPPPTLDVFQ